MKVLQILVLIILICGFSFSIKAQADCRYGLSFLVQNETGKLIKDTKIELVSLDSRVKLPSYVKLINIGDAFVFTSYAGTTVGGDFQVNISAEGFETYQQKVNFPVCKIQDFAIKLKYLAKEKNTSILSGSVYDANGALIIGAKVTAINEKGEKFETETNNEGIYNLELQYNPYGSDSNFRLAKYEIIVEKQHFEKTVLKDYKFAPSYKGKVNLDFALDVYTYDHPIIIESNKIKNNKEEK